MDNTKYAQMIINLKSQPNAQRNIKRMNCRQWTMCYHLPLWHSYWYPHYYYVLLLLVLPNQH